MIKPPNLSDYYPRRARMREITGRTQVRLTLDADGKVVRVEVLSSTPEGVFEVAARRVGRSLRFQPALRNNRPVATAVVLNLVWRLE
jgi:TonB family protein